MFKKLAKSIRKRLRPTERELALKRWRKEGAETRLRYDYPLTPASLVYDLGGYEGAWAAEIHRRYGCTVEIFEPAPGFASTIADRFKGNSRLPVHTLGLAARTRRERLNLNADGSSVFRPGDGDTVDIELVDVATWFAQRPDARVDLMKINIEGGEYELLERLLEAGLAGRVDHFQIQFHDLAPDSAARMRRILDGLAATHASTYSYTFVWEGLRRRN